MKSGIQGMPAEVRTSTGTGLLNFRHFSPEVPDSLHIGAYPFISAPNIRDLTNHERPANGVNKDRSSPDDLANCHAEGRGFESHQPLFRTPARRAGVRGSGAGRADRS